MFDFIEGVPGWLNWAVPIFTALTGFVSAFALFSPAVRRAREEVVELKRTVERVFRKYKDTLPAVAVGDAKALLRDADDVTESVADIVKILALFKFPGAKEGERFLRKLIHREWYE